MLRYGSPSVLCCGAAWLLLGAMSAHAQDVDPAKAALDARQAEIAAQLQRLESRMLELAERLAETEPANAERIRSGLDLLGRTQIRDRVNALIEKLRGADLADAEQVQVEVIRDLDGLLKLLRSSSSELERRREERRRLEETRRRIQRLADEQSTQLYRLMEKLENESQQATPPSDDGSPLDGLERAQRDLHRDADALSRELQETPPDAPKTPGSEGVQRSADRMRDAADQLGGKDGEKAKASEEAALEELQKTLDELDDALRQVRQEEREETLTALGARFRSMLEREREIREVVTSVADRPPGEWTRSEELAVQEAANRQSETAEDCRTALRILRDEGTTVIVPELVAAISSDMDRLAGWLGSSDLSATPLAVLDDVIASLEELVETMEDQREKESEDGPPQGPPPNSQQQTAGLLPPSTELRLLRSSQVRINERTQPLSEANVSEAGALERFQELAARQIRLAELARRMNERQ